MAFFAVELLLPRLTQLTGMARTYTILHDAGTNPGSFSIHSDATLADVC